MTNLTITVDEGVLRRARMRALEQGTSVNAVLRDYLVVYSAAEDERAKAIEAILALSSSANSTSSRFGMP
jgi:plasmid stability protein